MTVGNGRWLFLSSLILSQLGALESDCQNLKPSTFIISYVTLDKLCAFLASFLNWK